MALALEPLLILILHYNYHQFEEREFSLMFILAKFIWPNKNYSELPFNGFSLFQIIPLILIFIFLHFIFS